MSYNIHAQMPKKYVCDICEDEEEFVDWFCSNCTQNFCERCKIMHLKAKLCRNHVMIPIADAVHVQRDQDGICSEHREPFAFHCQTCDKAACVTCLSTLHKRHDFCTISEEIDMKKALFESCLLSKETELENLRKEVYRLEQSQCKYKQDCEDFERDIDKRIKDLHKKLTDLGNKIKEDSKTSVRTYSDEIAQMKEEVRLHDKQLSIWRGEFNARQEGALLRFITENQKNMSSYSLTVCDVTTPSMPVMVPEVDSNTLMSLLWSKTGGVGLSSGLQNITLLPIKGIQKIYDISITPDDNAWVVTASGCLYLIDKAGQELERYCKLKFPYFQHRICALRTEDVLISCTTDIRRIGRGLRESLFTRVDCAIFSSIRQCQVTNRVFAAIKINNQRSIKAYTEDGRFIISVDVPSCSTFGCLEDFTLNFDGNIYALYSRCVHVQNLSGTVLRTLQLKTGDSRKIKVDSRGNILILREGKSSVYIFDKADKYNEYPVNTKKEPSAFTQLLWDFDLDSKKRLWITTNCGHIVIVEYL